jgi:transposase-like protein
MSSSPIMRNATVAATTSWRDLLSGLKQPGLAGFEFVIPDNHAGRKAAIARALPEAWQRCCVHLLRNALDDVPRKGCRECSSRPAAPSLPRICISHSAHATVLWSN